MKAVQSAWRILAALLLALATVSQALAGSWMRSEGEYYYSSGLFYSSASRFYDDDSELVDIGCTTGNFYNDHHVEYGYSYYRTLFAHIALARTSCGSETENELGDLEIGVRGRIDPLRNGRSWEAAMILPTGSDNFNPAELGAGEFGLRLGAYGRFEAGGSLEFPNYLGLGAEVIFLLDDETPHRFRSDIDYELRQASFDIKVGLRADYALQNDGTAGSSSALDVTDDDYDEVTARVSVAHRVGDWSLSYQLSRVLRGRNIDDSTGVGVNLSLLWED